MFNRQPFNRAKFNLGTAQTTGASGLAQMKMETHPVDANRTLSANGVSNLNLKGFADANINKYGAQSIALLAMNHSANATKAFIASANTAHMVMGTAGSQTLSGEQVIKLNDIVLKPNDELIINTCDMTVTLNGQNAMQYFSGDSDFITMLNGLNTLIYSDGSLTRKAMFDVIWKDRWL